MKFLKRNIRISVLFFLLFVILTAALSFIDVQSIGPEGTKVGFASLNKFFHSITGVNMSLYYITDLLSVVPAVFIICFALLGLWQLIKRRNVKKVDKDILALGLFYVVVLSIYLFFETYVVNYRPILIDGSLEVSFPSSTTMLVMCVMPTAALMLNNRIKNKIMKKFSNTLIVLYTVAMVVLRLCSGVHWLTDIVGGILLSISLVSMYKAFSNN